VDRFRGHWSLWFTCSELRLDVSCMRRYIGLASPMTIFVIFVISGFRDEGGALLGSILLENASQKLHDKWRNDVVWSFGEFWLHSCPLALHSTRIITSAGAYHLLCVQGQTPSWRIWSRYMCEQLSCLQADAAEELDQSGGRSLLMTVQFFTHCIVQTHFRRKEKGTMEHWR